MLEACIAHHLTRKIVDALPLKLWVSCWFPFEPNSKRGTLKNHGDPILDQRLTPRGCDQQGVVDVLEELIRAKCGSNGAGLAFLGGRGSGLPAVPLEALEPIGKHLLQTGLRLKTQGDPIKTPKSALLHMTFPCHRTWSIPGPEKRSSSKRELLGVSTLVRGSLAYAVLLKQKKHVARCVKPRNPGSDVCCFLPF